MSSTFYHTPNRFGFHTLLACFILGFLIYVIVVIAAYYTQSAIIFGTGGLAAEPPSRFNIATVSFLTSDDVRLKGWWMDTPGAKRAVLFFHGNRRRPADYGQRLRTFAGLGVKALLFDYRGFGQSEGNIRRESDIYLDGQAAWNYLHKNHRIPARDIVLWGRSMGGAVAVEIARHQPAGLLVLESTFFDLEEMARIHYAWLPTRYLLKYHFGNGEKVADVCSPVIIVHSPEDGYIPFDQGRHLFDLAPEPKILLPTAGLHTEFFDGRSDFRAQFFDHFKRMADLGKAMARRP
jgi:fermentation-respiration switch protein FrsA (DUF1100 family)